MQTVDGRSVQILESNKSGMSVFTTYGLLDGKPCYWTAGGKFRMDGENDPRDIKEPS